MEILDYISTQEIAEVIFHHMTEKRETLKVARTEMYNEIFTDQVALKNTVEWIKHEVYRSAGQLAKYEITLVCVRLNLDES